MAAHGCNALLRCIVNVVRWVPVVFVALILCWAYYAYVVELCLFVVENIFEKVFYLAAFHGLIFLLVWSYWRTVFDPIWSPPEEFRLPSHVLDEYLRSNRARQHEILEIFASNLPITTRSYAEGVRYCAKCVMLKPDRAHHCGICGVCLLKMDHHCPWVNACVHFGNYKFFILFLGYAFVFCIFILCTDLQYFIMAWQHDFFTPQRKQRSRFQVMFLFFVAGMFSISVGCLFAYHLYLTWKNRTTLEACYAPVFRYGSDKNGFHVGVVNNFRQVFGEFNLKAFLPISTTPCDGVVFPTRRGLAHTPDYRTLRSAEHVNMGAGPRPPETPPAHGNGKNFLPTTAEGYMEGEPSQPLANFGARPIDGSQGQFMNRSVVVQDQHQSRNGLITDPFQTPSNVVGSTDFRGTDWKTTDNRNRIDGSVFDKSANGDAHNFGSTAYIGSGFDTKNRNRLNRFAWEPPKIQSRRHNETFIPLIRVGPDLSDDEGSV